LTTRDASDCWRSEKTAAYLSSVAAAEPDPAKAALFKEMAAAAEEQAGILAKDLGRTGLCAVASLSPHHHLHCHLRPARHASHPLSLQGAWHLGL
jgi:hypothetical protein